MMMNNDPTDGWGNTNWYKETFGTGYNYGSQHQLKRKVTIRLNILHHSASIHKMVM
jgi:hypothetical protein